MTTISQDLGGVVLLPCPCGRSAMLTPDTQRRVFFAECESASCWIGPDADTEGGAIAAWNSRQSPDRPSWKSAPEWATHLAMDKDGSWFWFDGKPEIAGFYWMPMGRFARIWREDWQQSLEARK